MCDNQYHDVWRHVSHCWLSSSPTLALHSLNLFLFLQLITDVIEGSFTKSSGTLLVVTNSVNSLPFNRNERNILMYKHYNPNSSLAMMYSLTNPLLQISSAELNGFKGWHTVDNSHEINNTILLCVFVRSV